MHSTGYNYELTNPENRKNLSTHYSPLVDNNINKFVKHGVNPAFNGKKKLSAFVFNDDALKDTDFYDTRKNYMVDLAIKIKLHLLKIIQMIIINSKEA